jgi:hypothetical protein
MDKPPPPIAGGRGFILKHFRGLRYASSPHLTLPLSRVPPSPPLGGGEGRGEVGNGARHFFFGSDLAS